MPLLSRFFGSLIDKFIIIITFILVAVMLSPYGAGGELGIFQGLLGASPNLYAYMPKSDVYMATDRYMSGLFIIVNILYYMICESFFKASFGKVIFGCYIVNGRKEELNSYNVFLRTICLASLMVIAVYFMHFSLGMKYYTVIILFFLALDLPVLFTRQSLIDLCSGTAYVKA